MRYNSSLNNFRQKIIFSLFSAENPLGLNNREARLADRVRGMQDENQVKLHFQIVAKNE